MWHKPLQDAWHHGKRTIGHMWNHAVKWTGKIDHAMSIGKRLYGALHPMIEDVGSSQMNRAVMQGIGRYEQVRNETVGYHNNVQTQLSRLRRAVPETDL